MAKKRKPSQPQVKLPKDALPMKKVSAALPPRKNEPPINKAVEEYVDKLMMTEWQSYLQRPRPAMKGFYVVCRWYPADKQWSILYVGRGAVSNRLDGLLAGKSNKPIARYLSSFPRHVRNLVWFKWYDDPSYPRDGYNLQDVLTVIAHKWNNGEVPAFNIDKIEELAGDQTTGKVKKPAKGSPLGL